MKWAEIERQSSLIETSIELELYSVIARVCYGATETSLWYRTSPKNVTIFAFTEHTRVSARDCRIVWFSTKGIYRRVWNRYKYAISLNQFLWLYPGNLTVFVSYNAMSKWAARCQICNANAHTSVYYAIKSFANTSLFPKWVTKDTIKLATFSKLQRPSGFNCHNCDPKLARSSNL